MSFAGVSVVGDSSPPRPASATTAVKYCGYHLLVVNGYSRIKNSPNGEHIASRHFRVGGYRWVIECYPNGYEPDHDGYVSFYLVLDQGNVVDPVTVQYEFSLVLDQVQGSESSSLTRAKEACGFLLMKETCGFYSSFAYSLPCLTKRKTFEKCGRGCHISGRRRDIRCTPVRARSPVCCLQGSAFWPHEGGSDNKCYTLANILALADQHHCGVLKEACLDFLNAPANLQEVMVVDGLDHVIISCPSVVKELIAKLASLKLDVNTGNTDASALALLEVPECDIHHHFSSLLQSEERTDVTFEVGGKTFSAHRCVLAARSAVFRAELFGRMKDTTTGVIRIDDIEAKVFKLLLTFIYNDSWPEMKVEEKNEDDADADVVWQQLLVAADRYCLDNLRLMCETMLCSYINATTVATILALAEEHHCRELKEECLDFLDFPANLQDVMAAGGLDHLRSRCPSVLIDVIAKLASIKHMTTDK
ncbi:unnamed protein product [Urochloa decumbens]|uniref:Uncharacterized protein n=1 Tax=Urochloa decumbens TaxID=240449 RepID=A0ABC9FXQ4_9POAL